MPKPAKVKSAISNSSNAKLASSSATKRAKGASKATKLEQASAATAKPRPADKAAKLKEERVLALAKGAAKSAKAKRADEMTELKKARTLALAKGAAKSAKAKRADKMTALGKARALALAKGAGNTAKASAAAKHQRADETPTLEKARTLALAEGAAKTAKASAGAKHQRGDETPTLEKARTLALAKGPAKTAKVKRADETTELDNAALAQGTLRSAEASPAAKHQRSDATGKLAAKSGKSVKPARAAKAPKLAAALPADDLPIISFETAGDWKQWLDRQHETARGLWLKLARKSSGIASVDRTEAVDGALCYGWIDGQGRSFDEDYYLIKFTPRGARSVWSKINRVKVQTLIERGLMQPAGLAEVERAQRDGRWDAAYDSPRTAAVPDDLAVALNAHPRARASFAELNAANRYAILWQLQTAKKAETRARRIARFIDMLERGETLH